MKYVIFSDIHGNIYSLKKMFEKTNNCDGYFFLGDIIGYFNHAEEVIEYIKNNNVISVLGNHDYNYLTLDLQKKTLLAKEFGISYLNRISNDSVNYLRSLPTSNTATINNKKIIFVHGTPEEHLCGRLYPDGNIEEIYDFDICFFGHTHYRMDKIINNTRYINPGSLGQPRDGNGFSYCIYDFVNNICEFFDVDIDNNLLINELNQQETSDKLKQYMIERLQKNEKNICDSDRR